MEVQYTTTLDDYVALVVHLNSTSRATRAMFIVCWVLSFLVPVGLGVLLVPVFWSEPLLAIFVAVVTGLTALVTPVVYPLFYRMFQPFFSRAITGYARMLITQRGVRGVIGDIRLILTEDTLTEITETTRTEARWSDMVRVEESGDYTFIFVTGAAVAILPRHGFADEDVYYLVRDYARSHVGEPKTVGSSSSSAIRAPR